MKDSHWGEIRKNAIIGREAAKIENLKWNRHRQKKERYSQF